MQQIIYPLGVRLKPFWYIFVCNLPDNITELCAIFGVVIFAAFGK